MPKASTSTTSTRKRKTVKKEEVNENTDHVIIQLPIQMDTIQELMPNESIIHSTEYNPSLMDPEPYEPSNQFVSENDTVGKMYEYHQPYTPILQESSSDMKETKNCCYWCCHSIVTKDFGMPIKYDAYHKTFTTFGNFCSFECIVAYNFSNHNGSDRMWEIHSWIQMVAEKMGFQTPIRPAPSRYLLKMFNGPLDIDEFRNVHKSNLKTYIMNIPPMVHVPSQMEVLNTSYLGTKATITTTESNEKNKLYRKRSVVDMKKSLQSKMNLTITNIEASSSP